MAVRDEVVKYLQELSNKDQLDHDVNLFEGGFLSSLDALSLFSYIEETFKITIEDDDLGVDNFGTINSIVNYIEKASSKGQ